MKACVLEKPYDVRIKELPIPEPKDDEVLLRVTVAGICTNDVRDYKGSRYTYPRIGGKSLEKMLITEYSILVKKW